MESMSVTARVVENLRLSATGPRKNQVLWFCNHSKKHTQKIVMTFCYSHRSISHSAIIKEVSCSRWELMQRHRSEQCVESKRLWDVFIKPFPSRIRCPCRRGSRKIARVKSNGQLTENSVFQIQEDWCPCELTGTVAAHAGPAYIQARQGSSTERRKWTQVPTPNQEARCNWHPLAKEKLASPVNSYCLLVILTTLKGGPPAVGWANHQCWVFHRTKRRLHLLPDLPWAWFFPPEYKQGACIPRCLGREMRHPGSCQATKSYMNRCHT